MARRLFSRMIWKGCNNSGPSQPPSYPPPGISRGRVGPAGGAAAPRLGPCGAPGRGPGPRLRCPVPGRPLPLAPRPGGCSHPRGGSHLREGQPRPRWVGGGGGGVGRAGPACGSPPLGVLFSPPSFVVKCVLATKIPTREWK